MLNCKDRPVFAELMILREKTWDGVWVSSFGGTKYLREMPIDSAGLSVDLCVVSLDHLVGAASTAGGIVRPSAFAVLRLMT